MSKQPWTKGPWTYELDNGEGGEWYTLSVSFGYGWNAPKAEQEEAEANARLASVAPELYEALSHLLQFVAHRNDSYTAAIHKAHAALARARGETP